MKLLNPKQWKDIAGAQQVIIEKALERIKELEAEVERLRRVHDTGYCEEHDSYLGSDASEVGCLVPYGVNPSGDTLGKERDEG